MQDRKLAEYVDNQLSLPLIVPYRNRLEHLVTFVPYMESFMKDIKFHIMLIEQADGKPFNRGKLLNIGFTVANAHDNWVCFHDIDMLPKDDSCDYSLPQHTTHLAGRVEQYGYRLPYPEYLGGVLLTTRVDFERVNGYSNEYWGWGNEDDDLFIRYLLAGVKIKRKPSLYISLPHERSHHSAENVERLMHSLEFTMRQSNVPRIIARAKQVMNLWESAGIKPPDHLGEKAGDYRSDGLSSLRYELLYRQPLNKLIKFNSQISDRHELISVKL